MSNPPLYPAPSEHDARGVWWTSEVNDPEWLALPPSDAAWLDAHPGTPLIGPFADATPESDEAIFDAWDAKGQPIDDPALDTYYEACTVAFKTAHHGTTTEAPADVRGVTVYDGGVLTRNGQGWMLAEIDGPLGTIRALREAIRDEPRLRLLTGWTATQQADSSEHLLVACAPEFGPLSALVTWLDQSPALAPNSPARVEPVDYLAQPAAKPRVFAIDSDGQTRTLRALLTCDTTEDAITVAHALTMSIADGDARRDDIEAIIAPLLSQAAMSTARTELDRTSGT